MQDVALQLRREITVGILRKTMSVSTMGMVSYRNKDERTAKYARQTRNAARAQVAQNAMMLEHQRQMITQNDHANVREEVRDMWAAQPPAPYIPAQAPAGPPAGWYPDPQGLAPVRWWDGGQWTDHTNYQQ
jgi:hypothetical protein